MPRPCFNRFFYVIILIISTSFIISDEFSEGPYGTGYYDIAGPFDLPDLNMTVQGDPNLDEIVNVQDIILVVGQILGNINLQGEGAEQADVNNDGIIDILDIVSIVGMIMNPQDPTWNFEDQWTGIESYIFIQYDPTITLSTALWASSTKEQLLEISPMNAHYFFISNRSQYQSDVEYIKGEFDNILSGLSTELQNHWNSHLHFINAQTSSLDNWLSDALSNKSSMGIDSFQKIRQIGYLGNPASFSGTYIHYLAHEALYYEHQLDILQDTGESYDEIVIFDEDIYTGGWASSIGEMIQVPTEFSSLSYNKMEVELLRGCPDGNGGYSDQGCDDYDRIAHMYFCEGQCYETQYYFNIDEQGCLDAGNSWNADDGVCYQIFYLDDVEQSICDETENYTWNENRECFEIARWITPFDRQPHSLTDITPFLAFFRSNGGEEKMIKFQESGWPNSLLTLKIRLYHGDNDNGVQREFIPVWNGTVQFNPNYGNNRPPQVFNIPENATKVEFVSYITGHGWGSAGCFNCCEFCNSQHNFSVNGGVLEFNQAFPDASSGTHCMQPETISQGVCPNQYGTWGYGRAGWCPGMDVDPFIIDITDAVQIGDENVIDYDACRVSGNNCVTPPTCQGDGYCPEIAMSSYIIIHY